MEKFIIKKYFDKTFIADSNPNMPGLNFSDIHIFGTYRDEAKDHIQHSNVMDILGSSKRIWVKEFPVDLNNGMWKIIVRIFTNRTDDFIPAELLSENNELYFQTFE